MPADLSQPGSPDQIVETLAQQQTDVDVLVNNAGFGARGPVAGLGVGRQLEMIEVNVAALTRLTALLLPGMLERRRGGISECGLHGRIPAGSQLGVYYATKAYVLSFTEALAEEVRGSGVRVSALLGPDRHRVRGAGRRGGSRLFRRGVMAAAGPPGPGTTACGEAKPWSFPACATAPWRLACACPRASLSPRSPATCRERCRLSGFTGRVGPPACVRPTRTRNRRARAGQQVSRHPGSLHTTLRNQPSPKARHTAAQSVRKRLPGAEPG